MKSTISAPSLRGRLAAVWLAVLALVATAHAQVPGLPPTDPATTAQIREWNSECLSCHAPGAVRNPPRPDLDLSKLMTLTTDPAKLAESNHAGMACRTCHVGGLRGYPHRGPDQAVRGQPETLQCSECHAKQSWHIDAQAARSVHSKNLSDRFTCSTCHDPHVYRAASRIRDPEQIVAQDNGICLACHDSDQRFAAFGGTLTPGRSRPQIDAIHSWLPNTRSHWASVRCIDCHTPASPTRTLAISHEILGKDRAQRDCVTCHSTNTALRTGLYRYVAESQTDQHGFLNSALAERSYVIGATRNSILDRWGLLLLAVAAGGVAIHAAIRLLASLLGRRHM